jgi:6-pyruvoyltetrahydropterin/6-carboxytetrahydropterin synthase
VTYRIGKEFHFSASHRLHGLPEGHPCGRLHGHNYVVDFELTTEQLDPVGFVVDYGNLKPISDMLDGALDHRHLNDVMDGNPTAENLARWLYDACRPDFPALTAVQVSETPKTWAEYRP